MKMITADEARQIVKGHEEALKQDFLNNRHRIAKAFESVVKFQSEQKRYYTISYSIHKQLLRDYPPSEEWGSSAILKEIEYLATTNGYHIDHKSDSGYGPTISWEKEVNI